MQERTNDEIRDEVRAHYAGVAKAEAKTGCAPGCCAPTRGASGVLGYSDAEMAAVPDGADLGLGCGNPQAIAALREGERVLDLGSGGGFDCLLAAAAVGERGRVIGVDMTPEMVRKARENAKKAGRANVEVRLGEIEKLPVQDGEVDVVISNCVVNLSPEKEAVFREAFRVLSPGGRIAISDVVALADIPAELRTSMALSACVAGAATVPELRGILERAGFVDIEIEPSEASREFISGWLPGMRAEDYVSSASIRARKPGRAAKSCCGPDCCT
ncbi:MAG: arsenite methyltransferase [Sandaracinus sp.]